MPESLNDAILTTWFEYQGDLQAVIDKHKLTAAQIRDFAADPIVRKTLDDYEALVARRQRIHAMTHQHNAAEMLSKSMFEAGSTIECRRAATALARLTRDMLRKDSSSARGGGSEAGGGAPEPTNTSTLQRPSSVIEITAPSVPSVTAPTQPPNHPAESLDNPHQPTADALPTTLNLIPLTDPPRKTDSP